MRADRGFYAHAILAVCCEMPVRFSITIRRHARLRNISEAIPETDWTPIPSYLALAMEPTTADRPLTPTVKIYRDNRSSMSIVPRFATATTQFGGFGLREQSQPLIS